MYVAASSLPYHVSGYTVRTQSLVRALSKAGVDITCALRPGYPADRGVAEPQADDRHFVDGITYIKIPGPHVRRMGLDEFFAEASTALERVAERLRPELIHAASNHVNALPALFAARRLGVPFVYEVRGQWELTAATRNPNWEGTERFCLEQELETLVARNADHVFALTQQLANDLGKRGVPRARITVVPNAVDTEQFAPRKKDPEAMLRFGLNASAFAIVYAGSLLHYEGLDDLVRAVSRLVAQGTDATLVIAGDGEASDGLKALTRELHIERHVKLVGKLHPADIPALWSIADVAAFPRKPFKVCQMVSPLKPLEPMAMGIPVVVSDVAALREMVSDGETALVHLAGDPESLAERLSELANDSAARHRIGRAAREAMLRERTWKIVAERVLDAYKRVLANNVVDTVQLTISRSSMTAEEKVLFEERLERAFNAGGAGAVRDLALRQASGSSKRFLAFCLMKAASCCQRSGEAESALELAHDALAEDASEGMLRSAARVLYASGAFSEAAEALARLERAAGRLAGKDEEFAREVRARNRLLALLHAPAASTRPVTIPRKSVYFLHFSLPYSSVGYATRSHGLIAGIRTLNYDIRPYTRPGFPHDFKPELAGTSLPELDIIDGIEYRRLFEGGRRGSSESEYLINSIDSYEQVLLAERPEIVHAASNYVTALPALIAARRVGLPFIYEIRGFWEITRSSRDNDFENSTRFALMREFEGLVAREADHVFTLTSAMKQELVRRGVAEEKISLVHNGVDAERFVPMKPSIALAQKLGLSLGVPVVGYVGSFVDYEGLDDLIRAAGLVARRGVDFRLLLVGDGAVMEELQRLVAEERLGDQVLLTGRVPHDQVEAYYSLVDICPFPRKPWEVCEMVSPLKPFEAMAMQKAVVVSSTHALSEIVEDGVTGLVFQKGSANALADALEELLRNGERREQLARAGRAWTLAHRTWLESAKVVATSYARTVAASATPSARNTA
jgi:glycosyltransferase involved in cell wall biosynthesis